MTAHPVRTTGSRPRGRLVWTCLAALTLAVELVVVPLRPGADVAAGRTTAGGEVPLPELIGARPDVTQMITVTGRDWGSLTGVLKAWRLNAHGAWFLARGPVKVVIGYHGWVVADQRKQATGTTPAGRFRIPYAFGRLPDPGAKLRYRQVDDNDWWPYEPRDPATYNVYQFHKAATTHWRKNKAEHLADYKLQYGYALVVGFNLPRGIHYSKARRQWVSTVHPAIHRGGGIFLHVRGDGYTAGCVAMRRSQIRWLVRWVDPDAHPRLVMGPREYIVTL